MGLRVRLKASFDVSGFPRQSRVVLRALQRYGMILADNGSPLVRERRALERLEQRRPALAAEVTGRNFEVVQPPGG